MVINVNIAILNLVLPPKLFWRFCMSHKSAMMTIKYNSVVLNHVFFNNESFNLSYGRLNIDCNVVNRIV